MEEMDSNTVAGKPKKKSHKKWWIIGILIVLFLCLIVTGIAALIGFSGFTFYKTLAAPVEPIKGHLKAINDGDYKEAYSYCSDSFKDETSYQELVMIIEDNPQIFESKNSSFTNVRIENKIATVSGTITGKDGTITPMTYQLIKEKGYWEILNFHEGVSEKDEEDATDI